MRIRRPRTVPVTCPSTSPATPAQEAALRHALREGGREIRQWSEGMARAVEDHERFRAQPHVRRRALEWEADLERVVRMPPPEPEPVELPTDEELKAILDELHLDNE